MPKWIAPPLWLVATQIVQVEDGGFVGEDRLLRVGVVDGEAADLVVFAGGPRGRAGIGVGVIQIDVMVRAEAGVEGDAQQAAFAARVDVAECRAVQVVPSLWTSLTLPALLEHEQAAVGREFHRRRRGSSPRPRWFR